MWSRALKYLLQTGIGYVIWPLVVSMLVQKHAYHWLDSSIDSFGEGALRMVSSDESMLYLPKVTQCPTCRGFKRS